MALVPILLQHKEPFNVYWIRLQGQFRLIKHHVSRLHDQEALRSPRTNRTLSSSESQLPRAGTNSHYPPACSTAGPWTESEPKDSWVLANSQLASYPSDRLHQAACHEATMGRPHSLNGHGPVKMSKYLVADHISDITPMTSALMHQC